MALTLITPPVEEPVTTSDMAFHLKREDTVEDDHYIEALLFAARETIEDATARSFVSATWKLTLHDFPFASAIRLPRSPLLEVVSVIYRDSNGASVTLTEGTDYYVGTASEPGTIQVVNAWPLTQCHPAAVEVTFRAGYVDTASVPDVGEVPQRAKLAILQLASHWYQNREPVETSTIASLPNHVDRLIRSLRVYGGE